MTYTIDSADYRLAKFKAELGDYVEMDSCLFYYLFTELFLMVDSRAKNMFPSFMGSTVISPVPSEDEDQPASEDDQDEQPDSGTV